MTSLSASKSSALTGTIKVPGDKSISHRSLILGGLAVGRTTVTGLLEGEDVLATAAAMRALGASVKRHEDGTWEIHGRGIGTLDEPEDVLDLGNSGTAARLLMGVVAGHPISAIFTGDASLRRRPMGRVITPLGQIGAAFHGRAGGKLPLCVVGARDPLPIRYTLPVASAQVKSAILLAGLNTAGETTVIEPEKTRDHTETMFRHFGAEVRVEDLPEGRVISVTGQPEFHGRDVVVPADPSSAAFPAVAALITPGSDILLEAVGLNPLRFGVFETLIEMGADIEITNRREEAGEPVGDIRVRASELKGIEVPAERAPSMIDEYPILSVAASFAEGATVMRGVGELRVKESDRLGTMARGLAKAGVRVEEGEDTLAVTGSSNGVAGDALIEADLDHRIAMSFLVLGMGAESPVAIDDARTIDTSFPDFAGLMRGAGAKIQERT
ncbi:3-phosphoshikimate 1-carboxyvinyltransferase [Nisaea acidiphila]|uniref:3-phosphoshikimate 1-carboxyvinyltransferase n=1 Tax=Nisaea acidiphila TaxID=1862145 RepID=A0A9J7AZU0_9PROT|nr:3-phosphoshikimate 1-carboxyvinyltransferase [Nisaea acidiphila]UUX51764.1 3-phosphoshikimate 1-carboxyvinyltransferase [Nisaea acidiphila]